MAPRPETKKWIGISLIFGAGVCLAMSLALSAQVRVFPYRLSYEQGIVFRRTVRLWSGSVAVMGVAGIVLVSAGGSRLNRRVGWGCILIAPSLFLFVPNFVHSITSAKNVCINDLRQIDGAKEQWALSNVVEGPMTVSMEELALYLRNRNPKCPEGGVYSIGKIDEAPRCSVAGHTL